MTENSPKVTYGPWRTQCHETLNNDINQYKDMKSVER